MTFKSLFSFRQSVVRSTRSDNDAGAIVFLMMALVFVPIILAHAAVAWQDQIGQIGTHPLAAIINMLVSVF